jgi:hypothetical protein
MPARERHEHCGGGSRAVGCRNVHGPDAGAHHPEREEAIPQFTSFRMQAAGDETAWSKLRPLLSWRYVYVLRFVRVAIDHRSLFASFPSLDVAAVTALAIWLFPLWRSWIAHNRRLLGP